MKTRQPLLSAQILVYQLNQLSKAQASRISFLLNHLELGAHNHTYSVAPYPPTRDETEHHTFFTVPSMTLFPTGIRMPPRMATAAPNTAPAISPHLLLQQPMVVCFSFRTTACLPGSLFSFCLRVCGVCWCVQFICVCVCLCPSRGGSRTGRLYHQRELTEQQRPDKGTDTSGRHAGTSYKLTYIMTR